jgi:hypothetical protein
LGVGDFGLAGRSGSDYLEIGGGLAFVQFIDGNLLVEHPRVVKNAGVVDFVE